MPVVHPMPRRRYVPQAWTAVAALALSAGCTDAGTNARLASPPDYEIQARYTTEGPLDDLSTVMLQATVRNLGGRVEEPATVSMYVDDRFVKEVVLRAPAPGAAAALSFDWEAEPGAHAIRFQLKRLALDPQSGAESSEANNAVTLSLTVPFRERRVVARTWHQSRAFLASVEEDAQFQELLAFARDSGFVIPSSARTLETQYDGEGVASLVTPMGDPGAPATSAPLLIAIRHPGQGGKTVTIPFLFRMVDRTTYLVYNTRGGTRVTRIGDSVVVSTITPPPSGWRASMAAVGTCQEDTSACDQIGVAVAQCDAIIAEFGDQEITLQDLALVEQVCGRVTALTNACNAARTDNPPVITTQIGTNGSGQCAHCNGTTLNLWTYYGWHAQATDDRGLTWNSGSSFLATCNGGSYTFSVTDCGGQTATVVVQAQRQDFTPVPNWPNCHNQGKASSLLFPDSPASLLGWSFPWKKCDGLPAGFQEDPGPGPLG